MSTSGSNGAASDADVQTAADASDAAVQRQREVYADQAEDAVEKIESTIGHLQESLKTAKADAKRLRAEANKGSE